MFFNQKHHQNAPFKMLSPEKSNCQCTLTLRTVTFTLLEVKILPP
jgi:hypothetical protein